MQIGLATVQSQSGALEEHAPRPSPLSCFSSEDGFERNISGGSRGKPRGSHWHYTSQNSQDAPQSEAPSCRISQATRSSFASSIADSEAVPRNRPLTVGQLVDTASVTRVHIMTSLQDSMWVHDGSADAKKWHSQEEQLARSGISVVEKLRPALAGFAAATVLGAFSVQQSLYLSLFGGDPALIGIFNIVLVAYDVWNGPVLGRLSDEGFFNVALFRNVQSWGRRAPLTLLTIPVGMVSCVSFFVGPESLSPVGVAIWFGCNRFITATAFSMFACASGAAVSELFPTQEERVVVLMFRGVANAIGTLLGAGVLGPIALSQGKAGSASQRHIFLAFGFGTAALWLLLAPWAMLQRKTLLTQTTEKPPSLCRACCDAFRAVPCFRWLCLSEHLIAAPMATIVMMIPFFMQQALEFSRDQVSMGMAAVVGTFGAFVLFGTPPAACLARRFDPSRVLGVLVSAAGVSVGIGFLLGWIFREEFLVSIACICVFTGIPGGTGAAMYLLNRNVIMAWIVDADQVCRARASGLLVDNPGRSGVQNVAEEKLGDRSPSSATKSTELPALPARRDGLFQAIAIAFQICGAAWTGMAAIGFSLLGYEASRDDAEPPQQQPDSCRYATFLLCTVVCPAALVAYGCCMLAFPLRGERVRELTRDYTRLYHMYESLQADSQAEDLCDDEMDEAVVDEHPESLSVVIERPCDEVDSSPKKMKSADTGIASTAVPSTLSLEADVDESNPVVFEEVQTWDVIEV
mmetsp:Transcript_42911/g.98486  ORF Transcript_42911/g.98486 Transcript_42911/m.98486 type:complete len:747 (-) Transcript_42911:354-2594(-)